MKALEEPIRQIISGIKEKVGAKTIINFTFYEIETEMKLSTYLALVGVVSAVRLEQKSMDKAGSQEDWGENIDWRNAGRRALDWGQRAGNWGADQVRNRWLVQEGDSMKIDPEGKLSQLEQELEAETPDTLHDKKLITKKVGHVYANSQMRDKNLDDEEENDHAEEKMRNEEEEDEQEDQDREEDNEENYNQEDWDWKAAAHKGLDWGKKFGNKAADWANSHFA